jgi:hypothetical protein
LNNKILNLQPILPAGQCYNASPVWKYTNTARGFLLMKNHRMMEESIWKHDRSKRCTYRLVWQGRLLGINQRDIGRENRSDRQ